MKNFIILFLSAACYFLLAISPSYAGISCQPIYGGGQTCVSVGNISINKLVWNPETNVFVENLGINDPKYRPGFIVNFKLNVTNTGDTAIPKVDIRDIFPNYVDFSSGAGSFDIDTRTLSFSIENLKPNETRTFIIIGKVVAASQLPVSQSIVCVVNQATAATSNNGTSQDNAQLCIENKVTPTPTIITKGGFPVLPITPITVTPPTGPSDFGLAGLTIAGMLGYFLRKRKAFS